MHMIVGKNKITNQMISDWQKCWNENQNSMHKLGGNIADRIVFSEGKALTHVQEIINNHFPQNKLAFAGMQRQYNAHLLHMDEPGTDRNYRSYTLLVPMVHDPRIKTIIFNEYANTNEEIKNRIIDYGEKELPYEAKSSLGISELSHTSQHWKHMQYFCDTLELQGTFDYNLGDYVIFDTNLIHSSNHWKSLEGWKEKNKFKEIIQAHFFDINEKL